MRTSRQYAADWGARRRADMRKARWCVMQAQRMLESFGDTERAANYRRLASTYVRDARANNRRRVQWLQRARARMSA